MPRKLPNDVSDRNLRIGYWVATHRVLLHRLYTILWAIIASISMLVFLAYFFQWLLHIKETKQIYRNSPISLVQYNAIQAPEQITIVRTQAVRFDDQTIQTLVHLKNTNRIWGASDVEYEVFYGGASAGKEHVTLAPLQEKILVKQNIPAPGSSLPQVSIVFHDNHWKKIPNSSFLPEENWEVVPATYAFRYIESTQEDIVYQSEVSFQLKNNSVYGFRGAQVVILLKDESDQIQAVRSLSLDEIASFETRQITFRWPEKLSRSLTPDIRVNVDRLTESQIIRSWK